MKTDHVHVSIIRRLSAFSYDIIVALGIIFIATAIILPLNHGLAIPTTNYFFKLYLLAILYLFFTEFTYKGGQTLGMMAWHYKVVSLDNSPLSRKQVGLRLAANIICILSFGILFFSDFSVRFSNTKLIRTCN